MAASWPAAADSQSFLQRHAHWHDVLDPSALLASHAEIQNSKSLLESLGSRNAEKKDDKVMMAEKLCEASVHPDSGHVLPIIFRPPAYVLLGAPLVVATLVPHATVASAFVFQLPFQTYNAGFALANGNRSQKKSEHPLYTSAVVLYLACLGAAPVLAMKKLGVRSPSGHSFFGRILPPPLYALLGGLSVVLMRFPEVEHGVQVVDREGNLVGASRNAAQKAMKETALSRSALFGVTTLVPSLLRRSPHMLRSPRVFSLLKHLAALVTFGMMVPVSFALFPQRGSIRRDDLEEELKEKTTEATLFYNRGL
ncbi:sideroflexin-4 isoform X2 [Bufo bufo]|uniref:sideroflexin-4 isoform X2 n=1 Tax=Bufo bufo TaxID=8384 RepID=UPI001ABDEBFF|nr:sideroflexin-4 isoform X2 [Bufo bufo]